MKVYNNEQILISNLFIVDVSYFQFKSGSNPSLTIAANAIRLAEYINVIGMAFS